MGSIVDFLAMSAVSTAVKKFQMQGVLKECCGNVEECPVFQYRRQSDLYCIDNLVFLLVLFLGPNVIQLLLEVGNDLAHLGQE